MKQRIKELSEQARVWAEVSYKNQNNQFTSHWDTPIGYTPSQFFEQKFAELIVGECMKLNHEHFNDEDPYSIDSLYRQHFGFEE